MWNGCLGLIMKKNDIYYSICSFWEKDLYSPSAIGSKFITTLDQLAPLDARAGRWGLLDWQYMTVTPLDHVAPKIFEWAEGQMLSADFSLEMDPKHIIRDPDFGYRLTALSDQVGHKTRENDMVVVGVTAGARWRNEAKFEIGGIGHPPDPIRITYPLYAAALKVLISNWACPWAYAKVFVSDMPPIVECVIGPEGYIPKPEQPMLHYEGAWIAYLSAPLAVGLTPPPEIVAEPTPGGGLILSAVLERLDPSLPEHERRSEMLRQILIERVGESEHTAQRPARIGGY